MEEILASIRRIIADDQGLSSQGVLRAEALHPLPVSVRVEADGEINSVEDHHSPVHVIDERRDTQDATGEPLTSGARLVSAETNATVTTAFKTLFASRFVQNSDAIVALTYDMLRPMLKTWLDENLPGMVEGLVRAEIERVSRGE
ncbi:MAG TPA: DUF2497 domain-containing protein [Beijerinckia sp.]|jgi:cell pole-organizing protein PopZ|nr:DUF2497 domain-containing protein [Beijerinckia sp.]